MPVVEMLPPVAFRLKKYGGTTLPEELAFSVTVPTNVSFMSTEPVALAVNVDALSVLAPVKAMPSVPAVRVVVAEFRAPPAVIPLAAPLAFKVNDDPELAFKVMLVFAVSMIETEPAEYAE